MRVFFLPSRYASLLALHRRPLLDGFRIDGAVLAAGLFYVYSAREPFELTARHGVFLLAGFLFASLIHARILRRGAASLDFYRRLPLDSRPVLALYYLLTILPAWAAFTLLFLLTGPVLEAAGFGWADPFPVARFSQVLFALFFIRTLTVNLMVAIRVHTALIGLYFVFLLFTLIYLLWLREVLEPLFLLGPTAMGAVFLLSTCGISFFALRRIGL